ncbi:diguanylate cyclase domain-containing protein [Cognatilysobacter lacus]|uniref:Diguanylate cyclase n=1 Tax=Cognatilysobacter lacus TaxID=1643323 RepID=A0A5D8Z0H3_9GAMM|nr:diguanylate cyclase [Lysobacter lacus]TZF88241.1 diguanylate cyclase [Lysobacter lacus]
MTLRRGGRGSIRRQLVVGVVLLQAVLMTTFTAQTALRQRASLRAGLDAHVMLVATRAMTPVTQALARHDDIALERAATALWDAGDIAGIEIRDSAGRLRWRRGDLADSPTLLVANKGQLRIAPDHASVDAAVRDMVRTGLPFAFAALALGAMLAMGLAHAVTRRLHGLLDVADAVREGRHDVRAPPSRVHEVARLVDSFNAMLDALDEREHALARLNGELEARVEERTGELAESIANHRAILEQANDAFVMLDEEGRIVEWNRAARTAFGWTRSQAYGRLFSEVILPEDERGAFDADLAGFIATGASERVGRRVELLARTRDQREIPIEMSMRSRWRGNRRYFDAFLRDISERRQLESSLAMQALHDPLTGLPNRRLLLESLPRATQRADRTGKAMGVYFIDLDGFKHVNDTCGHDAGDDVLREFACRIRDTVRAVDMVARLAGDEFVVVCEAFADAQANAELIAAKLLRVADAPYAVGAQQRRLSSSVGVAIYTPGAGLSPSMLLARADQAMYASKHGGKSRATLWTPALASARALAES